jgi:hypothetical protein
VDGQTRPCATTGDTRRNQGICRDGTQICYNSTWSQCIGEIAPREEICNSQDDDCDGQIDEGCGEQNELSCVPGYARACYTGDPKTRKVGSCRDGIQVCLYFEEIKGYRLGECERQVTPQQEICNGLDDNCDGLIDNDCQDPKGCTLGEKRSCFEGEQNKRNIGICKDGEQTCVAGANGETSWSACTGSTLPKTEECNGLDDNCDGQIDEGCPSCTLGDKRPCFDADPSKKDKGICKEGEQTCMVSANGAPNIWSACVGSVLPKAPECNGFDNDCDGKIDDNNCGACNKGDRRPCFYGRLSQRNTAACGDGEQICITLANGTTTWSACAGGIYPQPEECNGQDDDCDGQIDNNCTGSQCVLGVMRACFYGSPHKRGVGACKDGMQECIMTGGVIMWGDCEGSTEPSVELCNNQDDDCDGQIDNNCIACLADTSQPCYLGDPDKRGIGVCQDGTQYCLEDSNGVNGWGLCEDSGEPSAEVCNNKDDDCDGQIDEDTDPNNPLCSSNHHCIETSDITGSAIRFCAKECESNADCTSPNICAEVTNILGVRISACVE